jgi:4-amino-4-deoxy-L-arabinose transferase-like glycosyltransferase
MPHRFSNRFLFLVIAGLALLARLVYLYTYYRSPYWAIMALDPETHDLLARRIAAGLGLGSRAYFRAPLYLYLLGGVYKIFGSGYWAPRILQAWLGAVSAGLTFLLGRRLLSRPAAVAAGVLAALSWNLVYFDGELLLESLATFLSLAGLLMLQRERRAGRAWLFLTGVIFGLAAITRPNLLLVLAAVLALKLLEKPLALAARSALMLGLGISLPVAAVAARNLVIAHDWVTVASQGGINFYLGNNPSADGLTVVVPFPRRMIPRDFQARYQSDPWFKEDVWLSALYGAESAAGRPVPESEVSSYWYRESLRRMGPKPGTWLLLFLRKTYFLFHRTEISNNRDLDYHRAHFPALQALSLVNVSWIAPLALLGFGWALRDFRRFRWLLVFAATYSLTVIMFFVNSRFRAPLLPVALVFAMLAAERLAETAKAGAYPPLARALAALLLLAVFCNADLVRWNDRPLRAAMHLDLGLAFVRHQRYPEAEAELREALRIKDQFPEAHLSLGNVLALEKKEAQAIHEFVIALLQQPDYAEAHYNLGLTYRRLGRPEPAAEHFAEAHRLAPSLY